MKQFPTILLAEDNADDIFLMKRAFKQAAVPNPLTIVRDGQQAIDYLGGMPKSSRFTTKSPVSAPSLVLLDLKLPRRNGLEVLFWIRNQPSLKSLLVVMLTDSREEVDIATAYRFGANSYLVKPSNSEKLYELVKTLRFYWLVLNRPPVLEKAQTCAAK